MASVVSFFRTMRLTNLVFPEIFCERKLFSESRGWLLLSIFDPVEVMSFLENDCGKDSRFFSALFDCFSMKVSFAQRVPPWLKQTFSAWTNCLASSQFVFRHSESFLRRKIFTQKFFDNSCKVKSGFPVLCASLQVCLGSVNLIKLLK